MPKRPDDLDQMHIEEGSVRDEESQLNIGEKSLLSHNQSISEANLNKS